MGLDQTDDNDVLDKKFKTLSGPLQLLEVSDFGMDIVFSSCTKYDMCMYHLYVLICCLTDLGLL